MGRGVLAAAEGVAAWSTRVLPALAFALLPESVLALAAQEGDPAPTALDTQTPLPANLPPRLEMPPFVRMTVRAQRKTPLPPGQAAAPIHLLWDPDLVQATFESDARAVHAVYRWEGGSTTEGYQLGGKAFFVPSLRYPEAVLAAPGALGFFLNSQVSVPEGAARDFPGIGWYAPDRFAGAAQLAGRRVHVFAKGGSSPDGEILYLDAQTLRPVLFEGSAFRYAFDYVRLPGARIEPRGPHLQAIRNDLGEFAMGGPGIPL